MGGLVLACGDCAASHLPPDRQPLGVLLLIGALAVVGGAIVVWQLRRRRRPARVTDQWSALRVMGELCPHGWQAELTVHGRGGPAPDEAPSSPPPRVAVEWKLYEHGDRVAVARRVSADTIDDALARMVDDRRLDVTLEQIERTVARGDQT